MPGGNLMAQSFAKRKLIHKSADYESKFNFRRSPIKIKYLGFRQL